MIDLSEESVDIDSHLFLIPKWVELAGGSPPEFKRRGELPHMQFEKRGGQIDQALNKAGRIGIGTMALPERLPPLVRFPEVKPVEEIDPS